MQTLQVFEAFAAKRPMAPPHRVLLERAWLHGLPLDRFARTRGAPFPRALLEQLPAWEARLARLLSVEHSALSDDGSTRCVLRLEDGRSIESVWLPRGAVCVSTQVGCAVGCTFCCTGKSGLLRNLRADEIAAQVALARRSGHTVSRVVLMGMGEPLHNFEAVTQALDLLADAGGLAHKHIVLSSVGDPSAFERLAARRVRPALALSLHTLDDALRHELLPRAPRVGVDELLSAALAYSRRITWPLLVQWTLIEGVNDSQAEARELARRLSGQRALVNYIPLNAVDGLEQRRPSWSTGVELVRLLRAHGVLATLRRSSGQDVDGGCGQLRARALSANSNAV